MSGRHFALILLILSLLVAAGPTVPALAARGTPGSAEFGFGAHLNLSGSFSLDALRLASNLELDWLALDCSWFSIAPKAGSVDWARLDPILQAAARSNLSVMLSLSQAPDWALSPQGPDPAKTAQFVLQLIQRYPNIIRAVELFPGANTAQGWGRQPDPLAYLNTWNAVQAALLSAKSPTLLVAAGLIPVPAGTPATQAISDLAFLQELYAKAKSPLPIISMQAGNLTGDPLQASDKSENRVLRHYEDIRAVMLKNKQDAGLIWITHLAPPTGTIAPDDRHLLDTNLQARWLSQAYNQMKSQLYIGVVFLGPINPPAGADVAFSLLLPSGDYHPFYRSLRDMIAVDRSNNMISRPGRAKERLLAKSRP